MTTAHLLSEILRLKPREREHLLRTAIDSLPEEYAIDSDLTAEESTELDERLKDYAKNPGKGRTLAQVNARVKTKIKEINARRTSPTSTRKRKKRS